MESSPLWVARRSEIGTSGFSYREIQAKRELRSVEGHQRHAIKSNTLVSQRQENTGEAGIGPPLVGQWQAMALCSVALSVAVTASLALTARPPAQSQTYTRAQRNTSELHSGSWVYV